MYKGLPIIATDNRGHRELVKNNINGNLIKNDKEELVKKIQLLIKNKNKRAEYGKNSKKMSQKFLLENTKEEMREIYTKSIK